MNCITTWSLSAFFLKHFTKKSFGLLHCIVICNIGKLFLFNLIEPYDDKGCVTSILMEKKEL